MQNKILAHFLVEPPISCDSHLKTDSSCSCKLATPACVPKCVLSSVSLSRRQKGAFYTQLFHLHLICSFAIPPCSLDHSPFPSFIMPTWGAPAVSWFIWTFTELWQLFQCCLRVHPTSLNWFVKKVRNKKLISRLQHSKAGRTPARCLVLI